MDFYNQHLDIKRVMVALSGDLFCSNEPGLFKWIHESILNGGDPYFHLPDLLPYIETHDQATEDFKDPELWHRRAVLNVARVGRFSSDRTVREYAEGIWNVKPVR
jgi:starch phosphorylase